MAKRLQTCGFFCAVSINGLSCRTVARKGSELVAFGDAFELPISDDDPDALVSFQLWSEDQRHRGTLRGRADVPLYEMRRKRQREMQLTLRNVEGPKDQVGTMTLGARVATYMIFYDAIENDNDNIKKYHYSI